VEGIIGDLNHFGKVDAVWTFWMLGFQVGSMLGRSSCASIWDVGLWCAFWYEGF